MKSAFVTGGSGFLGLNLIVQLLKKNWKVTALHLPGEDSPYLSRLKVDKVADDILDYKSLVGAIPRKSDVVFHLAGDTSMWPRQAARQYAVNVTGTANACNAAIEKGADRLVFTSSISAYGYHPGGIIDERTPSNAPSCRMNYNRTKYLAEQEIIKAIDKGLDAVILNPCNIVGPYDPGNWSQLIKNVYHDRLPGVPPGAGTFAHVRDIATAHIAAAEKGRLGENYILGGVRASFGEVIQEIMKITGRSLYLKKISKTALKAAMYASTFTSLFTGREPMLTYPKYMRMVGTLSCDCTKAITELGFSTGTLREMLTDCYRWLEQEGLL